MNRLLPRFKNSHFQNEAKYKTLLVKMSFICMRLKIHFSANGFALGLALKQRLGTARKRNLGEDRSQKPLTQA